MATNKEVMIRISGMDCAECAERIRKAVAALPGVEAVQVFFGAAKASVRFDPNRGTVQAIRAAIEAEGYRVSGEGEVTASSSYPASFQRKILTFLGLAFGAVLFVVVVGEWLGALEALTARVPWPVGLLIVLVAGFPIFRNVIRATLRGRVISHTLMTVGAIAAFVVGQWATAAVVVFFMRLGDYAERATAGRARRAVRDLTVLAPQMARVERAGAEHEVPITDVRQGETVVVRPGERIPVDGEVLRGSGTVDQATITGESMPVEAGPGSQVFAATTLTLGSLRVRTTHIGPDTTFGRVIRLVEEAEANRADVQRIADKFSGYYLPVVLAVAAVAFFVRRDPLATSAVLVVACSCSFALATPIAMLASIGAAAKRGLLVKGGKYLEALARADVLLIDKTGTLTLGRPRLTDIVPLDGWGPHQLLLLAASAERYSEHPLAAAVREAAAERHLVLREAEDFVAIPGQGVRARVDGIDVAVGNAHLVPGADEAPVSTQLRSQGKTLLFLVCDGKLAAVFGASDELRPDVSEALAAAKALGIEQIELLTGDNEEAARAVAGPLGIPYRARLLPEDKITAVREYQSSGHTVVMIGDGVNDAPALAQADVGIAMGAAGSDVAIEAAHVALLREDWMLVPELLHIARRTMRVVKGNIGFTLLYNAVGLTLAATGFLPPVLAAAAQSLPDLGILGNSSRLLKASKLPRPSL